MDKDLNIYPSKATIEVDSMFLLCLNDIKEYMESFDSLSEVITTTDTMELTSPSELLGIEGHHLPPGLMDLDIKLSAKKETKELILERVIQMLNSIGL